MKKILIIFALCFFIIEDIDAKSYRIGDKISGQIEFYRSYKFQLPPGDWVVADRYGYEYYGFKSKGYRLLKIRNKKAIEGISIGELIIPAKWVGYIDPAINDIVFKNKYDGCYERPEYFYLEYYRKGSSFNCFWILHSDVYKELFDPDDPELRGINSHYKAWLRDNKIELPKVAIGSSHSYFSRLSGGKWFSMSHGFDPEALGGPKSKFIKEERSEYHKYNISEFPEHKKTIEKVASIAAKRHMQFELEVKAKDHHKLDLSSYINFNLEEAQSELSENILDKIKKLKNLYDAGVLTEEEFKLAKKKMLK